jgi:hypothetical protein
MLLKEIELRNLRLLRDVTIPFEHDGKPRPWTVFIGRNGTGKTSILQAIALAAAGNAGALSLADRVREDLPDTRAKEDATIRASFSFGEIGQKYGERPLAEEKKIDRPTGVSVDVTIPPGRDPLRAVSWYTTPASDKAPPPEGPATESTDPLVRARADNLNHWFAAGYGMYRVVQDPQLGQTAPPWPSIDRLRPLFGPVPLIGPNFADIFQRQELNLEFGRILRQIVKGNRDILPGIEDLELRGQGGIRSVRDLMQRPRFVERVGRDLVKFPATWFAHGHQSTIAWLSDLVGQVLLEAGSHVPPEVMEGIVLIDEIDLYLHPTWQVGFIQALRDTFPKLQFVATTHSPILLTGLRREEVFILERDETAGHVTWRNPVRDPRLLTGSELYEEFFEIRDLYPTDLARTLDEYRTLAMNPFRPQESEAIVDRLEAKLRGEGISVRKRVPRTAGGSEAAE